MNPNARASSAPVSGPTLDNRRVLAALIDLAIVGVAGAVILAAADALGGSPSEIGLPLTAVVLGWALYYYFACESGNGQTVGKRVMRLRVVRSDGDPADLRAVGLRTVLRLIDMQLVYLVGLIVMLATGERRGRLGDLVGDTMIVSVDEPAAAAPAVAQVPAMASKPSRIPIAESGPAFEEPLVEDEPVEVEEPVAEEAPDIASPAVKELASDVAAAAATDEEPVVEAEEPAVEAEEPVVEAEEPADEPDEQITVKPVETVAPIDLVMEADEADEDALAGERTRATRG